MKSKRWLCCWRSQLVAATTNRIALLCRAIDMRSLATTSTIPNSRPSGGITPAIFAIPRAGASVSN